MFSIIVPLYNKERYLEATLNSALHQTFKQFELLIIDDGSTDGSIPIVNKYLQDSRVKLISQKNAGVSAARNNGIRNARFDIIALLDADDLWHPEYLEQMALAWQQNQHLVAIASSNTRIIAFESPVFTPITEKLPLTIIENYFKDNDKSFHTSAITIKKRIFESGVQFDEHLTHGEDLDVWNSIMVNEKAGYITKILSFYSHAPVKAKRRYDYLPPIHKHLVGSILEKYKVWLQPSTVVPDGFRPYVYQYTLSTLMAYYYNNHRKEAAAILQMIPSEYKSQALRYNLYRLPYFLAKMIYNTLTRKAK